jgi:hypothetical protein
MNGNIQSNIVEEWLNGEISDDVNLLNYLKMGYAFSKINKNELKINSYFDLVELSITFE